VCITTNQPDTKYNLNPNPTTREHAIVNIQHVTAGYVGHVTFKVTCPTYPDKFIRDML